jgi:hypothetical protein
MLHRAHMTVLVFDKYASAAEHSWKKGPTLIGSPSCISLLQWDTRVKSFCWLILFTLCMHGIEMVTLLAYVGFVLCFCMQFMGNGRARKGRSMELGGVGEGGAVGRNRTSPPSGSAAAIGTATTPGPNGTSTSTGIGTSAAPGRNGTSTSAGIGTWATPGGDATSSSAAGNGSSGSAEPHGTTFSPTTQAATSSVAHWNATPTASAHWTRWITWLEMICVTLASTGRAARVYHGGMWVCPFFHRGHR